MKVEHAQKRNAGAGAGRRAVLFSRPDVGLYAASRGRGPDGTDLEAANAALGALETAAADLERFASRLNAGNGAEAKLALMDRLSEAFIRAATDIHELSKRRGRAVEATLTCGVIVDNTLIIAHVGDTRMYLVRSGQCTLLTLDHSLAAERVRRGTMASDDYRSSSLRRVLYNALGRLPHVDPDFLEVALEDDDVLVLCTDSVWEHVGDEGIKELAGSAPLAVLTTGLVDRADAADSEAAHAMLALRLRSAEAEAGRARQWSEALLMTPLFAQLDEAARLRLAPFLDEVAISAGETVFLEGQVGDKLFVVLQGQVVVTRSGVELTRLGVGQHFGEIALALRCPRSATITATQDTRLLSLDRSSLDELVARRPDLGAMLMTQFVHHLAIRLRDLSERYIRR